jgi:hypothetical protein
VAQEFHPSGAKADWFSQPHGTAESRAPSKQRLINDFLQGWLHGHACQLL